MDEVYDGPFCVLSIVDNRAFRRLAFRVLEHDPDADDVRPFLTDFKAQLDARELVVRGITTDGSPLYPKVLKELWPDAPHQICIFHVLKEITKAVRRALAKLRKDLAKQIPKLPRGRPRQDKQSRALTRKVKRLKERLAELFEHRHLFVRRRLRPAEQKVLARLLRGRPPLRALRQIMDEVYRLFDRRCRTATALQRLAKLRARVRRFKRLGKALDKLKSPTLDKALLFLDDELLGPTSNAVERGNRRFRKAQRSIYSARTAQQIRRRLALDLHREQRAARRAQTLQSLHRARSGHDSEPP
jgi:transposase-like protein